MDPSSSSSAEIVDNSDLDQHLDENSDGSDSESLPYTLSSPSDTLSDSDTHSVDSVNSAVGQTRKVSKVQIQVLQFIKELRDVPAQTVWDHIKDHRRMAAICPGIVDGVDYLQGDGGAGSISVIVLNPLYTPPGACNYVIHQVETSDEISRTSVVRCVGGMHQKRFHHYKSYMKVEPHDTLGDNSCVVRWRLEYKLRNPQCQLSQETKNAYLFSFDIIRDRYVSINQVERPIAGDVMGIKRLKMQARQLRILDEQEPEGLPDRSRKFRAQLVLKDIEEIDGENQENTLMKDNEENDGENQEKTEADEENGRDPASKSMSSHLSEPAGCWAMYIVFQPKSSLDPKVYAQGTALTEPHIEPYLEGKFVREVCAIYAASWTWLMVNVFLGKSMIVRLLSLLETHTPITVENAVIHVRKSNSLLKGFMPPLTPEADNHTWMLAKLHASTTDSNHHEIYSHLDSTHSEQEEGHQLDRKFCREC